jgi:membrane-associated phospholipid phosphatase
MTKLIPFLLCASATCTLFAKVEPKAGKWETWVIPSGSALRLPAPADGDTTATELQWVKDSLSQRDAATLATIRYWDAGSPGYRWMQIAERTVVNAGLATPLQTRALALVAAAISDATIAAWDSKYAFNRQHPSDLDPAVAPVVAVPQSPSYPSEHAVAAGAAAAVLGYLFPDQAETFSDMANQAATSRVTAGVAFPSDVSRGLDLGQIVGQAVIAFAQGDGSAQSFMGSYPPSPGVWSSANPVAPLAGTWKPWVLNTAQDVRPGPPPAFGTDAANKQYEGVKNLSRTNSTNHLAWFWQPGFFQEWLAQVDLEIFQNHLDSNPPRAARAYAYETIAQHDATLACWDTKYAYLELRPSQADPSTTTVFANPQHPGYPSGHACASGASAAVMSVLFPADARSFTGMANDAGTSTFDAAIHTQLDVSQGVGAGNSSGAENCGPSLGRRRKLKARRYAAPALLYKLFTEPSESISILHASCMLWRAIDFTTKTATIRRAGFASPWTGVQSR